MRAIDGDALLDKIAVMPIDIGFEDIERVEEIIKDMPTIEPERKNAENEMVVAHCDVKENAELIAKIMDCDVDGEIYQERKKGRWIDEGFYADGHGHHAYRCSECGGHIIEYEPDAFCRFCGADMTEDSE